MAIDRRNPQPRPEARASRPAPAAPPGPEPVVDGFVATLLQVAVLVLAVLWIYAPVCNLANPAEWLWDDDTLLTANATVQSTKPESLVALWVAPKGIDYFPLTYTALWLQWPLFGTWSTGYHLTSVVLHAVSALLLWRLLTALRAPGAWLAAALFAVHPLCVESVAWVAELKNTLSLPPFLLAAWHVVRFEDLGPREERAWSHYARALAWFLVAMFAKTSMVAFPVVMLAYAWYRRGRVTVRDAIHAVPFFLVSLVLGLVTVFYQWNNAIAGEKLPVGGVMARVAVVGMSLVHYLRTLVWPIDLLPIYERWRIDPPPAAMFLAWPVLAAVVWWCWFNRAGWGRHALFALAFFGLMVAPVLGFVDIAYMRITWAADHFIYLPMIGPLAALAAAVATGIERCRPRERRVAQLAVATVLAVLALLSFRYAAVWVNEDLLWEYTLRHNDNSWQAHNRLGARKYDRRQVDDTATTRGALHHFIRATELRPDLGETHNNLAMALAIKGRVDEAIEEFRAAVAATPDSTILRNNLGNTLVGARRFAEAREVYAALRAEFPDDPALMHNEGICLIQMGERDEAIARFRQALAIKPDLADAKQALAIALEEQAAQAGAPPRPVAPPLDLKPPASPTLGTPAP